LRVDPLHEDIERSCVSIIRARGGLWGGKAGKVVTVGVRGGFMTSVLVNKRRKRQERVLVFLLHSMGVFRYSILRTP